MANNVKRFDDFTGWLNLTQSSRIPDKDFVIAKNVYYNNAKQLQTRKWYKKFGNAIGTSPITSYFFYQRDDNLSTMALCHSGTNMYKYDEWTGNRLSIKSGLAEFEALYPSNRVRRDFCVYKNVVYLANGVDNYAKYDGTTYTEYSWQPKVRYVQYLGDRVYGCGDDTNPISLYYTWPAPADANTINSNVLVVWWDETGKINWLNEYGQIILVFKNNKIYAVDVTNNTSLPLDSQSWWYSDRTIYTVWNSLVYLNERWLDNLTKRSGADGIGAIESKTLSDKVRILTDQIEPVQYNANAGLYIKALNNYYFAFDTNNDNIPDTTLIYNSLVSARTQYIYPDLYDFGQYITNTWELKFLFASGAGGQMYEMESGFDDDGANIDVEIQTRAFDFGDPAQVKTFSFVDIIGRKQEWWSIDIEVISEYESVSTWQVTDNHINVNAISHTIWQSILWEETLGMWESLYEDTLELYPFTIRVPMYHRGSDLSVNLKSSWVQWILEKIRVGVDGEPTEVFNYNNIL